MRSLAITLVLVLAAVGAHALDVDGRASAVRTFTWSRAPDLERVGRYEPRGAETCAWRGIGDQESLVRAIITVENLATPKIETWWKSALVHAAANLGLRVPDLTYGPGRVRLSTAREAIGANGDLNNASGVSTDAEVAARLLDYCETKQVVAAVVQQILASRGREPLARLDLASVRTVARIYNGQAEPLTPEAAVAHETYTALVYALFQRYRFDGLGN
jgi:hypothetical protein